MDQKNKHMLPLLALSVSLIATPSFAAEDCVKEPIVGSGLGEIKTSILDEIKFQMIHGPEWKLMRGGKIDSDLAGYLKRTTRVEGTLVGEAGEEIKEVYYNRGAREFTAPQTYDPSRYYGEQLIDSENPQLPDARGAFLRANNFFSVKEQKQYDVDKNKLTQQNPLFDRDLLRKIGTTQKDELKAHSHNLTMSHVRGRDGVGPDYTYPGLAGGMSNTQFQVPAMRKDFSYLVHPSGGLETRPYNFSVNMYIKTELKCLEDSKVNYGKVVTLVKGEVTSYYQRLSEILRTQFRKLKDELGQ